MTRLQNHQLAGLIAHGEPPCGPKVRKPRNNEEMRLGIALTRWIDTVASKEFNFAKELWVHVPNGSAFGEELKHDYQKKGAAIRGKLLKLQGVRRGPPDYVLCVPKFITYSFVGVPAHKYTHALFVELKAKNGVVSPEQEAMHGYLTARGYKVCIIRTLAEGVKIIEEYLK